MDIKFPRNIFHSARLKLTLFYLSILIVFSLTITFSVRWFAQQAYESSDLEQRGQFSHLFVRDYGPYYQEAFPLPDSGIANIQSAQQAIVRQHLNQDMIIINLLALVVGGILSYWFAGYALRPIEESHEAQKRFAADASHELRTPLANMKVENEVFLRQKDFTPNEARELIVSNLEEVQRLENLATSLLAMTQYEHSDLRLSSISVKKIVENSISSAKKAATAKQIVYHEEVGSANIVGHKESLQELLSIVLDNAIKYSPKNSTIDIKGKKLSSHYSLHIRDQGPGISEKDLPYIFERFYQGDKARSSNKGGYGLGLSLATEICKANNISITASNHPDGGADFRILFNVR